jgi:hypothetical protein
MSKLAEAMRRALRPEARPIGFGIATAPPNRTVLLLARVAGGAEAGQVGGAADAFITSTTDGAPAGGTLLWGAEAAVAGRAGARALREAGADFLIFDDATTDASVLLEDGLGFIMRVDFEASDTYLRSVEGLPLDALLVPGLDGALTVRRTLDLRRLTAFTRKPLILPVRPDIDPTHLEALRDCGVLGVVAEGAEAVAALRAKIDALPPRRRTKDGRAVSLTLRTTGTSVTVEEPEEPDDLSGCRAGGGRAGPVRRRRAG